MKVNITLRGVVNMTNSEFKFYGCELAPCVVLTLQNKLAMTFRLYITRGLMDGITRLKIADVYAGNIKTNRESFEVSHYRSVDDGFNLDYYSYRDIDLFKAILDAHKTYIKKCNVQEVEALKTIISFLELWISENKDSNFTILQHSAEEIDRIKAKMDIETSWFNSLKRVLLLK